jgi:hypothetical protein
MFDCGKCKNQNICRFIKEALDIKEKVAGIEKPYNSPFRIDFKCEAFQENINTRDCFGAGNYTDALNALKKQY